jgi:hypothetical protein
MRYLISEVSAELIGIYRNDVLYIGSRIATVSDLSVNLKRHFQVTVCCAGSSKVLPVPAGRPWVQRTLKKCQEGPLLPIVRMRYG